MSLPQKSPYKKRGLILFLYGLASVVWMYVSLRFQIELPVVNIFVFPWLPLLAIWGFGGYFWLVLAFSALWFIYWGILEFLFWVTARK